MEDVVAATAAFAAAAAATARHVDRLVPEPYMDEIFHVPQAQRYCSGDWTSWDPKITTFPGTYVVAVGVCKAAGWAGRVAASAAAAVGGGEGEDLCSTAALRATVTAMGVACLPLAWSLARDTERHGAGPDGQAGAGGSSGASGRRLLRALAMALFPTHFFHAFLFYTDVPSTFWVLSTAWALGRRRGALAAALAALAILARQTNAVWVGFLVGEAALEAAAGERTTAAAPETGLASQAAEALALLARPRAWRRFARAAAPSLLPLTAFAVFLRVNGGVVVGDRDNHAPTLHLAQLCYLFLALGAALWPVTLEVAVGWALAAGRSARGLASPRRRPAAGGAASPPLARGLASASAPLALALVSAALLRWGVRAHPFLLADNRHYASVLWRHVLSRPARRLLLAPLAAAGGTAVARTFHVGRGSARAPAYPELWLLGLLLASAAALVPSALLEPRYLTPPALLMLARAPSLSSGRLASLVLSFALIDALTLYVFLHRPYVWGDGTVARRLW